MVFLEGDGDWLKQAPPWPQPSCVPCTTLGKGVCDCDAGRDGERRVCDDECVDVGERVAERVAVDECVADLVVEGERVDVRVAVDVRDPVCDGSPVNVVDAVRDAVGDAVALAVAESADDDVMVGDVVAVCVPVVADADGDDEADEDDDCDAEVDAEGERDGVDERDACDVRELERVCDAVGVGVRDGVPAGVGLCDGVGVGVPVADIDVVGLGDDDDVAVGVTLGVSDDEDVVDPVPDCVWLRVAVGVTRDAMSMPCTVSPRTPPAAASQDG